MFYWGYVTPKMVTRKIERELKQLPGIPRARCQSTNWRSEMVVPIQQDSLSIIYITVTLIDYGECLVLEMGLGECFTTIHVDYKPNNDDFDWRVATIGIYERRKLRAYCTQAAVLISNYVDLVESIGMDKFMHFSFVADDSEAHPQQ